MGICGSTKQGHWPEKVKKSFNKNDNINSDVDTFLNTHNFIALMFQEISKSSKNKYNIYTLLVCNVSLYYNMIFTILNVLTVHT